MQTIVNIAMANEVSERAANAVGERFGFKEWEVKPLEADAADPLRFCRFEVRGTVYRVSGGSISVAPAEA